MTPPSIRYQLYPELISGDNCHETETGYLITKYGTYDPNMCFIISDSGLSDKVNWRTFSEDSPFTSIKFDASTILFIPGEYWMGKNSMRHCFEPREDGDYILIAAYWGGRCDVTKGSEFSELKEKAKRFIEMADRLEISYHHTAAILRSIGQDYVRESKWDYLYSEIGDV